MFSVIYCLGLIVCTEEAIETKGPDKTVKVNKHLNLDNMTKAKYKTFCTRKWKTNIQLWTMRDADHTKNRGWHKKRISFHCVKEPCTCTCVRVEVIGRPNKTDYDLNKSTSVNHQFLQVLDWSKEDLVSITDQFNNRRVFVHACIFVFTIVKIVFKLQRDR